MVLVLTVVVAVCFGASLLPFLFPGAVVGLFGVILNSGLGELLVLILGVSPGALVTGGSGGVILTLPGVLAVYVPLLLLLLFVQRNR